MFDEQCLARVEHRVRQAAALEVLSPGAAASGEKRGREIVIEDDSAARMARTQGLHAGLMKRLRAEPQKEAERPSGMSWAQMLSWLRLSVTARVLFAIGAVGIVMLLIVRWAGEGGRNDSGNLAANAENKPAELDFFAGEPAGPAELRRSLVHSLEDFEVVLRRNDRASARRDPVAVPANARPVEGL